MKYPDNPCVAVCDTLYQDYCTGCGRHFSEVAGWVFMDDSEKQVIWERIIADGTSKRFNTYKERAQENQK